MTNLAQFLPGPAGSVFASTFRMIGIAEDELARARLSKAKASAVFKAACPSAPLRERGDELYRAHIRELITRARKGASLAPGTDAECLGATLAASLRAPLNRQWQAIAERLFERVFPEKAKTVLEDGKPAAEPWAGSSEEEIGALRKRLKVDR